MEITWLSDPVVLSVVSGGLGILFTLLGQRLLHKRGRFSYQVHHNHLAVSGDDDVFGSVRVTWNNNPVSNLFASTIELTNESLRDYENVVVRIYSNDTLLLNERTEIVGTTHFVPWESEYARRLAIPPGEEPTQEQYQTYSRSRDYVVPVFNRGQTVRFTYLNSALEAPPPTIWLDVLHKGIKTGFRMPQQEVLGVPQPLAASVGSLVGLMAVSVMVLSLDSRILVALSAFVLGLVAQLPGAGLVRVWRKVRSLIGD